MLPNGYHCSPNSHGGLLQFSCLSKLTAAARFQSTAASQFEVCHEMLTTASDCRHHMWQHIQVQLAAVHYHQTCFKQSLSRVQTSRSWLHSQCHPDTRHYECGTLPHSTKFVHHPINTPPMQCIDNLHLLNPAMPHHNVAYSRKSSSV
jgi:hypothetical protein